MSTNIKKTAATTTSTPVAKKEEVKEVNDNLSQENELLKKQMEAMQAQMELLVKQVSMNTNTTNTTNQNQKEILNLSIWFLALLY